MTFQGFLLMCSRELPSSCQSVKGKMTACCFLRPCQESPPPSKAPPGPPPTHPQNASCLATRYKLPIVCKSWAVALDHAPALWQTVLIDSRQKVRTSRRRPLKKPSHFPTATSVLIWFSRHGSQVQQLTLANIDETALQATPEGCIGAGGIAQALALAAPSLLTLAFVDCCLPALLGPPLDALAALPHLRALTLSLPDLEHAWTAAAFDCLTQLTGLEELALTAAPLHRQWLPCGLSALNRLTSLSIATPNARSELVLPRGLRCGQPLVWGCSRSCPLFLQLAMFRDPPCRPCPSALAPTLCHLSIENHILLWPHEEVC